MADVTATTPKLKAAPISHAKSPVAGHYGHRVQRSPTPPIAYLVNDGSEAGAASPTGPLLAAPSSITFPNLLRFSVLNLAHLTDNHPG